MRLIKIIAILSCLICSVSSSHAEQKLSITFISCCLKEGFFWPQVESFMNAAAKDLNINLEVIYSKMNHIRMKEIAEDVANRENPPDYLIIDNYKLMAGKMIKAIHPTGVKVFLMANALSSEQLQAFGKPREKYPNWIGELEPDNHAVGKHLAKILISNSLNSGKRASDGKLHLIALAGDNQTPAGLQRIDGLLEEVSRNEDVFLRQVVPCHWQQTESRNKISLILNRYPETGAIWSDNDEMALGAMEGLIALGKKPGRDILITGVNWKKEALLKIADKSMLASGGGHFMMGGLSLILLYDYHWGKDFAQEGVQLKMKLFEVLDAENIDDYLAKFGDENWDKIDFTAFSKVLNPSVQTYDFSLKALLSK